METEVQKQRLGLPSQPLTLTLPGLCTFLMTFPLLVSPSLALTVVSIRLYQRLQLEGNNQEEAGRIQTKPLLAKKPPGRHAALSRGSNAAGPSSEF